MSLEPANPETRSRSLDRYRSGVGANRYADKFERSWSRKRTHRRERRILRHFLSGLDPAGSLLNLACGTGRFTDLLDPNNRPQAHYADASAAMLAKARETVGPSGHDRVQFSVIDLTTAAPDGRHDLVTCIRCLHHLDAGARSKALDYLTESAGQCLIFTVASTSTWKGWWRAFRTRRGSRRHGEYLMSRPEIRDELAARSFVVQETRRVSPLFSSQYWVLAHRSPESAP